MYTKRIPTPAELLYINRAQQKIAELSAVTASEIALNDVTYKYVDLAIELQYSIECLYSTFLDWSEDDIQMMMDYYTIAAQLAVFSHKVIPPFVNIPVVGEVWATIPQLNTVNETSIARDNEITATLEREITRLEELISDLQSSASGTLTEAITVQVNVGGISMPKTYPIGTSLEDILQELLSIPSLVKNFTASGHSAIVQAGSSMSITQFTWGVEGVPRNLKLTDSEGILVNVPVSGTGYTPPAPVVYNLAGVKTITWTLSGDNIPSITLQAKSFYKSYFGKQIASNDTPLSVTPAQITAATVFSIGDTSEKITLNANTSNVEQGWVAVPKASSGTAYTKWRVDDTNFSNIIVGEFIIPPVDVLVGGVTYSVYRWGYRSPLNLPLTLHR